MCGEKYNSVRTKQTFTDFSPSFCFSSEGSLTSLTCCFWIKIIPDGLHVMCCKNLKHNNYFSIFNAFLFVRVCSVFHIMPDLYSCRLDYSFCASCSIFSSELRLVFLLRINNLASDCTLTRHRFYKRRARFKSGSQSKPFRRFFLPLIM